MDKQTFAMNTLQDGEPTHCKGNNKKGGLNGGYQLKRCIFSYPTEWTGSEVPAISLGQEGIPVSLPFIRSISGSTNIYQSDEVGIRTIAGNRNSLGRLYRQYAVNGRVCGGVLFKNVAHHKLSQSAGLDNKLGEIKTSATAKSDLSRSMSGFLQHVLSCTKGQSSKYKEGYQYVDEQRDSEQRDHSQRVVKGDWEDYGSRTSSTPYQTENMGDVKMQEQPFFFWVGKEN